MRAVVLKLSDKKLKLTAYSVFMFIVTKWEVDFYGSKDPICLTAFVIIMSWERNDSANFQLESNKNAAKVFVETVRSTIHICNKSKLTKYLYRIFKLFCSILLTCELKKLKYSGTPLQRSPWSNERFPSARPNLVTVIYMEQKSDIRNMFPSP